MATYTGLTLALVELILILTWDLQVSAAEGTGQGKLPAMAGAAGVPWVP